MMPSWWHYNSSFLHKLIQIALRPASWLYQLLSFMRIKTVMPHIPAIPALCIGNATVGGAGKTPVTLFLAELLQSLGHSPQIASRGYGSDAASLPTAFSVDPAHDKAEHVGDEPLMMAEYFPVWVGQSRATCIAAAKESGASIALMDDGLQNPTIQKTASFLVMDGGFGVGNGLIFPAGPLRETLKTALKKVCAVFIVGEDRTGCEAMVSAADDSIPIFHVTSETVLPDDAKKTPLLAFAGLARPEKFFEGVQQAGGNILQTHPFPDHHPYTEKTIAALIHDAHSHGATLITTQKDAAKITPHQCEHLLVADLILRLEEAEQPALKALLERLAPITY